MDTGAKTLAQLAEEGKEKKYVTLDTAAKISGYTKDYLERLCRLNKIEYRLWNNGNFVLELESLLRETQAILLSYEGISFVEKSELTDPAPQIVGTILSDALKEIGTTTASFSEAAQKPAIEAAIPSFGGTITKDQSTFSFVGRAVISDALHPEEKEAKKPASAGQEPMKSEVKGITGIASALRVEETKETTEPLKEERVMPPSVVKKLDIAAISGAALEAEPGKTVAEKVREHIPIQAINTPHDEWDKQLFGGASEERMHAPTHIAVTKEIPHDALETPVPFSSPVHLAVKKETDAATEPLPSPQKQKVIVFTDVAPAKKVEAAPSVKSLPHIASTEPIPPPSTAPLPMLTHTPELTLPPEHRPMAPAPMPMPSPSSLPMRGEEHHLALYQTHPLMRSGGFNVVFAALLIVSSLTLFGGKLLVDLGESSSLDYIAGVGAALGIEASPKDQRTVAAESGTQALLPFSSELATSTGERPDSLIVRPVFESGPGKPYEYILVPSAPASSSPADER